MRERKSVEITPLSRRCLEQLTVHLACRPPFSSPRESDMLTHALEYGLAQLVRLARRQFGWEVEPPPATLEQLAELADRQKEKTG